jgi:hypothetical protein
MAAVRDRIGPPTGLLGEMLHGDLKILPLTVEAADPPAEPARRLEAVLAGFPPPRSLGAAARTEYVRGAELALGGGTIQVRPVVAAR